MAEESMPSRQLCEFLKTLPRVYKNRYTEQAERDLLQSLFWSLAGGRTEHLNLFFPEHSRPSATESWKLRKAQGGTDGDEFTEAARGKVCGHIFKNGEATYRCKTCSSDDTCVLCSRCYDSSDHTGHMVYVSVSLGNSGCCDCGDPEAWRLPVHCSIHTAHGPGSKSEDKGKTVGLPEELVESIRMTIGRAFDYICDVISCSPEQLRLPKSKESIQSDERRSRLTSSYYNGDIIEDPCEYALLLWNDEKHTVNEVRDQVARACKVTNAEGMQRAHETDDIGRSVIKYSTDIDKLLRVSRVVEQIKVTVTIRSARDTFREQMCGTIIEWLSDISGCSVGPDHNILRQVVCEEMLKQWSRGSEASNADIGLNGIDDHEKEESLWSDVEQRALRHIRDRQTRALAVMAAVAANDTDSDDTDNGDDDRFGTLFDGPNPFLVHTVDDDDEDGSSDEEVELVQFDPTELRVLQPTRQQAIPRPETETDNDGDVDMIGGVDDGALEVQEATLAGYPPPPPPPPAPQRVTRDRDLTPSDSDTAEMQPLISDNVYAKAKMEIPKTPKNPLKKEIAKPARYWLESPPGYTDRESVPLHEDLWNKVRLDWLILFDLRMWKKVRVDLRELYISTVVSIPEFKRVLGLRFAGLYTTLAQLYLIADREPDHSIINISLQMLTTPSITAEIVERGNFLTNLMAILYTFLTTRQVGHPYEIFPNATLAFDSGSVTNRRMYHFFMDLKYLFGSEHVQEKLRTDERYMLQFLDLVKLHQGICPNVRAVGEHVEYETDAWISASLITREINRLCRQFSESFKWTPGESTEPVCRAIRTAAKSVILSSLGTERKRFIQAEIKDEVKFKKVADYEFDTTEQSNSVVQHSVVKFVVESQPISFHHALHYTLSWLIESGKSMPRQELIQLLSFTTQELFAKPKSMGQRTMPSQQYSPEDHLMAAFDYPLRVCAWLAQMKANMWVRNGMSLRHQQGTYRGVTLRDVSHHRDIFLLQTAMVVCPPARMLASIIDRFGLEQWMKGLYEAKSDGVDDGQILDIAEDLIHLLIVLISDRTSLVSNDDDPGSHIMAMRRDITHVLCFKPLSFTEICSKLPDKFQDQEECQDILDEMTNFKPPEGLSDVGTFELKEQYLEDIDPYIAHYSKNQREESENTYKAWVAKKTGRPLAEIVFEPKLRPIESGAFSDLAAFTRTGMFAQIVYYALLYPLVADKLTPAVPVTRVEAFLHVVLHLVLIAISEDRTDEDEMSEESLESFIYIALTCNARSNFSPSAPASKTIVAILEMLSRKEEFKTCHPKITLVLKRMKQRRPRNFATAFSRLGVPVDRISTASPANNNALEDKEKKKQAALERQKRVMAQFQQQQKNFLDNQGDIDWGEDDISDSDMESEGESSKTYYQYPSGTCILCQEETKDGRLYGTFALMTTSSVLRQTDMSDPDFVREAANVPSNLDQSAEDIRPFGVSGANREQVHKVTSSGVDIVTERSFIGKGFPSEFTRPGPVSVGCGHIMHYKCFEVYYEASNRRHQHQIARHHPEKLELNEFVCPLCKALGNSFLPIIWSPKEEIYLGPLKTADTFDDWIEKFAGASPHPRTERINELGSAHNYDNKADFPSSRRTMQIFKKHNDDTMASPLVSKMPELLMDAWDPPSPTHWSPFTPQRTTLPPDIANAIWSENSLPLPGDRASNTTSSVRELTDIYRRLRDTMTKNKLKTSHKDKLSIRQERDFCSSDILAKALGSSISAVEIQHRGVAALPGQTFLESLPQQALTHLRILSETALSYVTVGGLKLAGDNRVAQEFSADYEVQYTRLFENPAYSKFCLPFDIELEPLLFQDPFIFLAEASLCLALVDDIEILHLVRLCYLAELTKVVMQLGRHIDKLKWYNMTEIYRQKGFDKFGEFCRHVQAQDIKDSASSEFTSLHAFETLEDCRSFVQNYALVYLRKVMILLNVRYGIAFKNHVSSDSAMDELDRLTEALFLPTFSEMFAHFGNRDGTIPSLVSRWIHHANFFNDVSISNSQHSQQWQSFSNDISFMNDITRVPFEMPGDQIDFTKSLIANASEGNLKALRLKSRLNGFNNGMCISHPTIFELIGLPKNYDTLMEETMKRRCPNSKRDIQDPMLCLFCGEIFCGQSICCSRDGPEKPNGGPRDKIGGGQQHMLKCQKNTALFLNIRKCCIFYLYRTSGSWMVAPYIDKYGEVDPGLRHSRQLFLNQKRYDALLRTVWLSHGIPSVISRKLEMDINNGGWETI
ncbi:E3 ubiquitin-protein ligase ubr1 [Ciborinia camelliae]|nr:E3 ubiquitin-protein ligase ubr1 [Ciborinia camelliae]